ncbi:MAG TPA: type I-E CRISPR-associated protein Cas5/CasD, partial [Hyphomicrobiaceae bacterium]|nr:type I-E CRISPR-associated protein Cas5/CasD [Hyphomicrobiaceae bacterium]
SSPRRHTPRRDPMPEFLIFRLYGPLAAWGDIAVGERRGSYSRPSKSAVLGLVAAALGIDRNDDDAHRALDGGYGFAVRVDAPGVPIRDFHTAQVPSQRRGKTWPTRHAELAEEQLNTIVSARDYYADALYTVALWPREAAAYSLEALKAALDWPHYHLYLGRRSCPPALPLGAEIVSAPGLVAAFEAAGFPASDLIRRLYPRQPAAALLAWDPDAPGDRPVETRRIMLRDGIASRTRRQFASRSEAIGAVPNRVDGGTRRGGA